MAAAPPAPCTARAATRAGNVTAMPHKSEPRENTATPTWNTSTLPKISPSLPNTKSSAHVVSRYTDETHCIWPSPTASSFCITGSGTLTMLESSVAMNVITRTVNRIAHLLFPCMLPSTTSTIR